MDQYLAETETMNYSHSSVQEIIDELALDGMSDVDKAERLFYYVRDFITYSVRDLSISRDYFKASNVLQQEYTYCIPKAILLATLARAVGIPSRLHLVDFINHRLSPELEQLWGTNIMAPHSYTELFLEDKWVKLTPALDQATCDKHDFVVPEFEPGEDSLLSPFDRHGRPHVEYIRDHGTFADLPLETIHEILHDVYGNQSEELLAHMFGTDITEFA